MNTSDLNKLIDLHELWYESSGKDGKKLIVDESSFYQLNADKRVIVESIFTDMEFDNCSFKSADLRNARLSGSSFNNTDFTNAELTKAEIDEAVFHNVNFENAIACRTSLAESNFAKCNFKNANFKGAFLYGSNFNDCIFEGADITQANFTGAKIKKEDLAKAIGFESIIGSPVYE